jgi:hydroxyacylglutathione hydrolase
MVGNLKIETLHTPGHTPESISFLLTDTPASQEPVMFFTGDFVFVGDIGRPDLLEKAAGMTGTMDAGAHQMYKSIDRFSKLPDHIQVWPGHGAGSACGKALGAVPSSTVGYEKIRNWAFRFANDENGFVNFLLADQPEPPKYFAMMKKLNKVDRPLLTSVPKLKQLTNNEMILPRALSPAASTSRVTTHLLPGRDGTSTMMSLSCSWPMNPCSMTLAAN